jgi:hypothetical protein
MVFTMNSDQLMDILIAFALNSEQLMEILMVFTMNSDQLMQILILFTKNSDQNLHILRKGRRTITLYPLTRSRAILKHTHRTYRTYIHTCLSMNESLSRALPYRTRTRNRGGQSQERGGAGAREHDVVFGVLEHDARRLACIHKNTNTQVYIHTYIQIRTVPYVPYRIIVPYRTVTYIIVSSRVRWAASRPSCTLVLLNTMPAASHVRIHKNTCVYVYIYIYIYTCIYIYIHTVLLSSR